MTIVFWRSPDLFDVVQHAADVLVQRRHQPQIAFHVLLVNQPRVVRPIARVLLLEALVLRIIVDEQTRPDDGVGDRFRRAALVIVQQIGRLREHGVLEQVLEPRGRAVRRMGALWWIIRQNGLSCGRCLSQSNATSVITSVI